MKETHLFFNSLKKRSSIYYSKHTHMDKNMFIYKQTDKQVSACNHRSDEPLIWIRGKKMLIKIVFNPMLIDWFHWCVCVSVFLYFRLFPMQSRLWSVRKLLNKKKRSIWIFKDIHALSIKFWIIFFFFFKWLLDWILRSNLQQKQQLNNF